MYQRPSWAKKGFNRQIYASITNEINYQIGQLRKRGFEPTLVRLGPAASIVYANEHWSHGIGGGPQYHKGYKCEVPIKYRDKSISGVIVEGSSASQSQP